MIIYIAVNKINGKRYVGATSKSLNHRKTSHWHDANGKNYCRIFGAALKKYGKDNFDWSVLLECASKEEMAREEIRLIAELNPEYNITIGGQGIFGVPYTEERREKLSNSLKGRKMPPHQRIKNIEILALARAKRHRAVVCLQDGKFYSSCKMAEEFYGITTTNIRSVARGDQTISKGLSFVFSKTPLSAEECRRHLLKLQERRDAERARILSGTRSKPITCVNDGKIYKNSLVASGIYQISPTRINQLCNRGGATQGGLRFMFVGERAPRDQKPRTLEQVLAGVVLRNAALRKGVLKNSKRVICLDDNSMYESISAAARSIGRCVESVSASIRRNGKAGGKTFQFEASS